MNQISEITFIDEGWFRVLAQRKRELHLGLSVNSPRCLIAVFGGAWYAKDSLEWQWAFQVGREIANGGGIIFSGGYEGVMAGASAGGADAGGEVVGLTCDNLPEDKPNEFITHEWKVPRWDQRMLGLVWLADGYIVMPGSSGTMLELAMVLETQKKGFIPIRPIACYGDFWKPVVERVKAPGDILCFCANAAQCADHVLVSNR